MFITVRIKPILLLGVTAVSLSACSSDRSGLDRVRVSGTVFYDGQPLETGLIEFYPIEGTGGPSTGGVIQQGRYDVPAQKGPVVGGTYQVRITSMRKSGKTSFDRDRPNQPIDWLVNFVPAQYNTESKLKATIASDPSKNQFDFNLQPVLASRTPRDP